ncbi:hypothetical protein [Streptomyces sp. NPDC059708]|uniref:hypothetical protein n=1 Tax=Streptomyces sp. NPDC059708 TaxID=3346916 RepID=UPI0036C7C16B
MAPETPHLPRTAVATGSLLFVAALTTADLSTQTQGRLCAARGKGVTSVLFEWWFGAVARACGDVLGPAGGTGTSRSRVSPPQEHIQGARLCDLRGTAIAASQAVYGQVRYSSFINPGDPEQDGHTGDCGGLDAEQVQPGLLGELFVPQPLGVLRYPAGALRQTWVSISAPAGRPLAERLRPERRRGPARMVGRRAGREGERLADP